MNKRRYSIALLAASALILGTVNAHAAPVVIEDEYIGNQTLRKGYQEDPSNPDVYDPFGTGYNVSKMEVTLKGSVLTVQLFGEYFSSWFTSEKGDMFEPGSLFLSTDGWKPGDIGPTYGTKKGESWELAVTLNDILLWNPDGSPLTSGTTSLYSTADGTIMPGWLRIEEEAWFDPTDVNGELGSGFWLLTADSLTISIDLANSDWDGKELGIHWTMLCGNDVIEGLFTPGSPGTNPVPEPTTALLFGAGLLGLAGCSRRRIR